MTEQELTDRTEQVKDLGQHVRKAISATLREHTDENAPDVDRILVATLLVVIEHLSMTVWLAADDPKVAIGIMQDVFDGLIDEMGEKAHEHMLLQNMLGLRQGTQNSSVPTDDALTAALMAMFTAAKHPSDN